VGFVLAALFMPEVGWRDSLIGIAVGGGVLFATRYLYQLVRGQEGVGLGDVFLLAMVGAFIGWEGVLFTLFFGALLGSFGGLLVGLFGTSAAEPELPPSEHAAAAEAGAEASSSIDSQAPAGAAAESEEHSLLTTAVPFGPFLSLAAGCYALFQPQLANWYLSR
jgi:prepilin signal peptidase PulO-like enzyme (type II secretory pathway)